MRPSGLTAFWWIAYALVTVMVGTNIVSPLYSVYGQRFGFSPLVVTVVFAIYIAVIVPGLLVFGPLADSIGRRPVLLGALAFMAAGSLTLAFAADVRWLLAGRVLEGISFAAAIGTGAAALVEAHPRHDHRLAATVTTGAFMGGSALGPLMTGVLSQYGPWPFQLTYLAHVGMLAIAIGAVALVPEPLPPGSRRPFRPARPAIPAAALAPFARAAAAAAVAGTCGAVYLALSASYATSLLHTGNLAVIGGVVALFLTSGAVTPLTLRSASPSASGCIGLVAVAIGMVAAAAAGPTRSVAMLAMGAVLAGGGQGYAFRGTLAMVSTLAPASARADVTSAFYAVIYLTVGVAAVSLGLAATAWTLSRAIPGFAAVLVPLALATAIMLSRAQRPPLERAAGEARDIIS